MHSQNDTCHMSYSHSFRYCKRCQKSTVHDRHEVVENDGKREEKHRCTQCDTETVRLIRDRAHSHA